MVTLKDIEAAHERIRPLIHRTPVFTNSSLNKLSGAELYFKCDNFQKAGSFKIRGATNTVEQLTIEELSRGVATTSSGNHGAALSMAVTRRGGTTKVVMPNNTPEIKVNNVERNGGEVVWCEPEQESRESVLKDLIEKQVLLWFIRIMMSGLWPGRGPARRNCSKITQNLMLSSHLSAVVDY